MKNSRSLFLFLLILIMSGSCVEPYEPEVLLNPQNLLVVEGNLSIGREYSVIKLSRTVSLSSSADFVPEDNAQMSIESKGGNSYSLLNATNGVYVLESQDLDKSDQYRLRIRTQDGNEYLSDYVNVIETPPIDSVSWKYKDDGVYLYVNTHDPDNDSRYYRWEYEETWEFNVPYESLIEIVENRFVERPAPTEKYCWRNNISSHLMLGSSAKLEQDIISEYFLTMIPRASRKLSSKYSILVRQYALSKEAFDYFQQMERNTEQRGSFFDPQPVELKGNIQNINSPSEPVIGFFSMGSVESERIFIDREEVLTPDWGFRLNCVIEEVEPKDVGSRTPLFLGLLGTVYVSEFHCVDCTQGGIPVKPDFWE